jgi:hypothetical protein
MGIIPLGDASLAHVGGFGVLTTRVLITAGRVARPADPGGE